LRGSRDAISSRVSLRGFVLGLLRKIPKIGTIEEFDADLTPALSIVVAIDDACSNALAFVFAAENHQSTFFDEMPANQPCAVAAQSGSPRFLFPRSTGFFAADVNGNG
jgi:hypothetical protein